MGKVLDAIKAQIVREGETVENLQILKLYNMLIDRKLTSSIMFNEITNCQFIRYGLASYQSHRKYTIKPEFLDLLNNWNKENEDAK